MLHHTGNMTRFSRKQMHRYSELLRRLKRSQNAEHRSTFTNICAKIIGMGMRPIRLSKYSPLNHIIHPALLLPHVVSIGLLVGDTSVDCPCLAGTWTRTVHYPNTRRKSTCCYAQWFCPSQRCRSAAPILSGKRCMC